MLNKKSCVNDNDIVNFSKKRTLSQLPTNNDVFHSSTSDLCVWCRFCAQILLLASIRCRVYGVDSVRKFFYCWCEPVYMVPILGTNLIFIVTHEAVAYMVLAYKVTNGFYRVSFYQFLWDVITARAFFFFLLSFVIAFVEFLDHSIICVAN